ncbi:unnamed protein product [Caenorhabditis sp. 36 PRJEB53466]|nr:unnamed protein product [Caenorhabditis sp. 36 PRJEB53466]
MRSFFAILALATISYAQFAQQLPCGFSCSRRTVVNAIIDGQPGTATCSENTNPARCLGCCQSRALQDGLTVDRASGFLSNDQRSCVCCFSNSNRNCGNNNTFGK